jgi:homoserine kinase type II
VDGRPVVDVDGVPLALLGWVGGTPLDVADQHLIGATLARVHAILTGASVDGVAHFHWVDPGAEHLSLRPWIRPAVAAAVAALDQLGPGALSRGLLHTDPSPDAFRWDAARGRCGLIDWSTAMRGPLLYDLASAVMYVGGPDQAGALVDGYLEHGVLAPAEVERGLATMLRFRWAVQADYFARRIVTGDLTGIAGPADNEKGLEDAREWFVELGARR